MWIFRKLMQARRMNFLAWPHVYHQVHAVEVPRETPRTCWMNGKALTLAEIPVELRHCMGFCEFREYSNSYPLGQTTAFIPHDLGEGVLYLEHRHTARNLDEV